MSTTEYEVTEEDFEQLKRAAKKFGIILGDEPETEAERPETEAERPNIHETEPKTESKKETKKETKKEEKKQKKRKDNIKAPEANEGTNEAPAVPVQIAGSQPRKEKKVREHWYKTATPEKKLESSMKARISYYMRNRGITKEEAEKVIAEIDAKKKPKPKPNPNPSPNPNPIPNPNPTPSPNPNPSPNPELPALPVAPPPLIRARPIQVPDIPVTNPNKWKIGLRRK